MADTVSLVCVMAGKAEEIKQGFAETMQDAKEKTEFLADWTHDKLGQNSSFDQQHARQAAQNMKYKAEDAASRATETIKSAASGA